MSVHAYVAKLSTCLLSGHLIKQFFEFLCIARCSFLISECWRRSPWLFVASRAHIPEVSRAVEAHGSSDSLAAPVFGTNADQHPNTSKRVRMHPNTFEHVGTHAKASKNVRKDVKTLRRVWKIFQRIKYLVTSKRSRALQHAFERRTYPNASQ